MLYTVRYVHNISQRCGRCGRPRNSHHSLHMHQGSEWGHGIAGDDCTGFEHERGQVADLPSSVVELGDLLAVARMLRNARLIGRAEQLRDLRRERIPGTQDTKLLAFPRTGAYHALILEPNREPEPWGSDCVLDANTGIYRIRWTRNGYCYVTSIVTGALLGAYVEGKWDDKGRLPDTVRSSALDLSSLGRRNPPQETTP